MTGVPCAALPAEWVLRADRVITAEADLPAGWVHVRGSAVVAVGPGDPPAGVPIAPCPPGSTIVPGLVDMHVHGAGGASLTAADPQQVDRALTALAGHGVTSAVASLVTLPLVEMLDALDGLAPSADRVGAPGRAHLLGSHLEGPFLSPAHQGAHHGPSLRPPDPAVLAELIQAAAGTLRMLTLAPELPGGLDLIAQARAAGVVVAMGHTSATDEQTRAAVAAGVTVATHLFNGMRAPHHREPGPTLTLLDAPQVTVELINDGHHVHPTAGRIACRAAGSGRLALISDGVAATAAPDGDYLLGRVPIRSRAGAVQTADGSSLGGGGCTLEVALARAVTVLGLSLPEAVAAATWIPAAALGVADRAGDLAAGRSADLCVLDADLGLRAVLLRGAWVEPGPAGPLGPVTVTS